MNFFIPTQAWKYLRGGNIIEVVSEGKKKSNERKIFIEPLYFLYSTQVHMYIYVLIFTSVSDGLGRRVQVIIMTLNKF